MTFELSTLTRLPEGNQAENKIATHARKRSAKLFAGSQEVDLTPSVGILYFYKIYRVKIIQRLNCGR